GLEGDEELLADALDLHQVLGAREGLLLAVLDDALGDFGAETRQIRELRRGRRVDVDLLGRSGSVAAFSEEQCGSAEMEKNDQARGANPGWFHRELLPNVREMRIRNRSSKMQSECPHRVLAIRRSPSAPPFVRATLIANGVPAL